MKGMREGLPQMTMEELCSHFGIRPTTVYYYRKIGAISPPEGPRGNKRPWTEMHVHQIRTIRDVAHDQRVTLADIAENPKKYYGRV
jgi:DNA-binding transcriptional MerR regulator